MKSLDKQDWEKRFKREFGQHEEIWNGKKFHKDGIEIKSFIQSELDRQEKNILLEYFEKEDNLVDKYANLKDDDWSNFLEERSNLKIKSLKEKV
jgi:hypothetical protein